MFNVGDRVKVIGDFRAKALRNEIGIIAEVHIHEEGYDEDDEIVIEEYVQYIVNFGRVITGERGYQLTHNAGVFADDYYYWLEEYELEKENDLEIIEIEDPEYSKMFE